MIIPAITIVIAVYLMRFGSAIKDGLSHRATVSPTDPRRVARAPWHRFGWVGRDIPQLVLLCVAAWLIPLNFLSFVFFIVANAALNFVLHRLLYDWAVRNRARFTKKPNSFIDVLYRRIRLFLNIVWRPDGSAAPGDSRWTIFREHRVEIKTAWEVACIAHSRKQWHSHNELIICPNCRSAQKAAVVESRPFWQRVHRCTNCRYIIMESEWDTFEYPTEPNNGAESGL